MSLRKELASLRAKLRKAKTHHGKKSKKSKAKKARRDPSWFGHKAAHAKAARLGHRRAGHKVKKAKKSGARRDPAGYRRSTLGRRKGAAHPWYVMRDPAWYGDKAHHSRAAKLGHKRAGHHVKAKKAAKKSHRDPARYTSKRGRRSAVHPWYIMRDPSRYTVETRGGFARPGKASGRR